MTKVNAKRLSALIGCTAALFAWFYDKFCAGLTVCVREAEDARV